MSFSFVSADIDKISEFERRSSLAITEFNKIKSEFETTNSDLINNWKGDGAEKYKFKTDHILENVGSLGDVLTSINEGVIKDIKDAYLKLDEELGEFNRNPSSESAE